MSNYKFFMFLFLLILLATRISGQNLYPEKFDECQISSFCLDCGDVKAILPETFLKGFLKGLDQESLKKTIGDIEIQILIDTIGKPCLISADNQTNVKSKKLKLQQALNNSTYWVPAIRNKKPIVSSVSIIIRFEKSDIRLARRSFNSENETNMRSEGSPIIKGASAKSLSESWTVYDQNNSELPWDMTRSVVKDLDNAIWIGTDNGIVKIENETWKHFNTQNAAINPTKYDKTKTEDVSDIAVDRKNNKWFISAWDVYKYDNVNWVIFDSINSPINWARNVFVDKSDNVWFTSWDGLAKFDGEKWRVIDTTNSEIPTNKVMGAFVDSRNHIWVGTFNGNVMIDGKKTVRFIDPDSPLSKANITRGYEDKEGNIWFSLDSEKSINSGIFILHPDGSWQRIKHSNPEMFKNFINDFLLDEEKNILWIALNGVGLLKYDIKSELWEIYTNQNSKVPSNIVSKISIDKDGLIWATTFAGVIKQNKK